MGGFRGMRGTGRTLPPTQIEGGMSAISGCTARSRSSVPGSKMSGITMKSKSSKAIKDDESRRAARKKFPGQSRGHTMNKICRIRIRAILGVYPDECIHEDYYPRGRNNKKIHNMDKWSDAVLENLYDLAKLIGSKDKKHEDLAESIKNQSKEKKKETEEEFSSRIRIEIQARIATTGATKGDLMVKDVVAAISKAKEAFGK